MIGGLLAACGADPDMQDALAPGGARVGKTEVVALDNVFGDDGADVKVPVGGTVEWVNQGRNDHDIVAVNGPEGFGVDGDAFQPGKTYDETFEEEGVFRYYCSLHGNKSGGMTGRIIVGDAEVPDEELALDADAPAEVSGRTIAVPADEPTIQKAVDAAGPGDLILVSPGTYEEAVQVPATKPYLTIRGLDRSKTILDGGFERANGVQVVKAKGVAVENLTLRNYTKNGVFWTGVVGYRGSYLTTVRNGDYGVYAFESTKGQIDHSYASGSPDAGFYIGGCQPCDAVITDVVSEWNGLGYSGTNSGGNLVIANSTWRHNRAGIVPNSGSYEPDAPQRDNTIVGNLVYDNNNGKTPAIDVAITAMGNGILIAGGEDNVIERNRVWDHDLGGIVVITYPESAEYVWKANGNKVRDNVAHDNRLGDLGIWIGTEEEGNCFSGNDYGTTSPLDLEQALPCTGTGTGDLSRGGFDVGRLATNEGKPDAVPYEDTQLPEVPPQPEMPDAASAKATAAIDVPMKIDVAAIPTPDAPADAGS